MDEESYSSGPMEVPSDGIDGQITPSHLYSVGSFIYLRTPNLLIFVLTKLVLHIGISCVFLSCIIITLVLLLFQLL